MRISLELLLSSFLPCVLGVATNRTIDDTFGDEATGAKPLYLPEIGAWSDAKCGGCAIQPDKERAHNGTWMAATFMPENFKEMSVTLHFKGTAIYIFFIMANFISHDVTSETVCNFTLDGQPAVPFSHTPTSSRDMEYNFLVFSKVRLENIDHTLVISTSGLDRHVFVNFDYTMYTFDDDIPNPLAGASVASSLDSSTPTLGSTSTPGSGSSPALSSTVNTLPPTMSDSSSLSAVGVPPSTTAYSSPSASLSSPVQEPLLPSDSSTASSGLKRNTGAIAGGVIGGVILLLIPMLLFVMLRRRKQVQQSWTKVTSAFQRDSAARFDRARFTSSHSYNSRLNSEKPSHQQRAVSGNETAYEDYGYGGYSMVDTKIDLATQSHASQLK